MHFLTHECAGPRKINGVPFTRVSQSSVIATSTKIDLAGVKADKLDDGLFKSTVVKAAKKTEADFFQGVCFSHISSIPFFFLLCTPLRQLPTLLRIG